MFLGGVWRRLWPTAIPRYKVLALRPPVVCVCVCVSVFGVSLLAKVSIANCSSTEPCNFRTTETNAGRQRQRDMLLPLSLLLLHCTTLNSPSTHSARGAKLSNVPAVPKGVAAPVRGLCARNISCFLVGCVGQGKSRVAGYFMRPLWCHPGTCAAPLPCSD